MPSIINATTSTGLVSSADNSGSLQLATNNGTTAVTIDTSQNVGIGTTSPQQTLHVNNASSPRIKLTNATTGTGSSDGSEISIFDADTSLRIINRESANILFGTADTERMRITSGGNLFVNCTSEPSSSVKGWGLTQIASGNYVSSATTNSGNFDHYYFYSVSGLAGFIRTNGTTCTYNSVSDARLKNNIIDAPSALDVVNNIKVRSFDWKTGNGHVDYGFVAQELNDVAPQAVAEGENTEEGEIKTPWAVDSSMLVPMLAKALQELNAKVEAQAVRIAELEGAK